MLFARARRSALIRILTFLFLLRVGFDLGAHGLLASDFPPVAAGPSSVCVGADAGGSVPDGSHDHCICHGLSVGAVQPVALAVLSPAGSIAPAFYPLAPHAERYPLDRPPRLV